MLPRAYRQVGLRTDLVDLTDVASCRMYHNTRQVIDGVMKNATEAIASPRAIGIWTTLLLVGQILPAALLVANALDWLAVPYLPLVAASAVAPVFVRIVQAWRFNQSVLWAIAHAVSVAMFLALQWSALVRSTLGWQSSWRGRVFRSHDAI